MADAHKAALALLGALPSGLPARRYVLNSPLAAAAFDCEATLVAVERVFSGLPGAESATPAFCLSPRSAEMSVAVVRCVPTGGSNPPSVAEMAASAASLLADLAVLESAVVASATNGTVADDLSEIVMGRGYLLSPSGGFGGAALSVTVSL